jgi:hypothetical protein
MLKKALAGDFIMQAATRTSDLSTQGRSSNGSDFPAVTKAFPPSSSFSIWPKFSAIEFEDFEPSKAFAGEVNEVVSVHDGRRKAARRSKPRGEVPAPRGSGSSDGKWECTAKAFESSCGEHGRTGGETQAGKRAGAGIIAEPAPVRGGAKLKDSMQEHLSRSRRATQQKRSLASAPDSSPNSHHPLTRGAILGNSWRLSSGDHAGHAHPTVGAMAGVQ